MEVSCCASTAHLRGRSGLKEGHQRVFVKDESPGGSYACSDSDAVALVHAGSIRRRGAGERSRETSGFRVIDEQGRIRQHIKFFVNRAQASSLATPLAHDDEVMIVCALSGG